MKKNLVSFSRSVVLFFRRTPVQKANKILGSILKYTFFTLVLLLLYLPIVVIAIQSVNDSSQFYNFTGFTFQWWINVFTLNLSGELLVAIKTTLIVALVATLISTVLGTIISIGIHSLTKKKRQAMVLLNQVPILNADIVTGLSLMVVFKLIMTFIPNLFGLGTLIMAHVFFCMPYVILSVLPKLSELDENLYDAALDLGCRPATGIIKVIVPSISSGIFSGMLIAFTMSIDDFLISFFNTGDNGGLFDLGTNNLSTYIYGSYNRTGFDLSVYAYSTLLSLLVFIALAVVYIRSSVKKAKAEHKFSKSIKEQKI